MKAREYDRIRSKFPHRREQLLKANRSRIEFFGRSIYLGWNPKKNICNKCKKTVELGEIKYTNMHHLEYCIIFPWFGTIELCRRCHNLEHKDKLVKNLYYNH
jgi:hypothetical protein